MPNLNKIYLGRQPIFDTSLKIYAYELLFRSGEQLDANVTHDNQATAKVMMNLFGEFGLTNIVGDKKAFINFSEDLLLKDTRSFFPRKKVVIEVLETVPSTGKIISTLKKISKEGYQLALDDFIFSSETKSLEDYVDIIKVDILEAGPKKMIANMPKLKAKGKRLLAEKVETKQQFEFCKKLGFDYFQGYFFAKPKIIVGEALSANKVAILQLLASVYDEDIDMDVLSKIIRRDVSLSQKLLKIAVLENNNIEIKSIHDVVLRFGLVRLQSWTSMMALSDSFDKPAELLTTSLVRAKFCELVGSKVNDAPKDSYFIVGLFSTLDAVMDKPLKELITELNFSKEIINALLSHQGNLGVTLNAVKKIELGSMDYEMPVGLDATDLAKLYLEAMSFANSLDL